MLGWRVLSLAAGYARLDLAPDDDFGRVPESLRTLLQVCHMNGLRGGLIVSRQDAFDWRSSLRIGLRFAATRTSVPGIRLALVAGHFNDGAREDVLAVASDVGLECRVFRDEAEAIAWLMEEKRPSGGAAPGRGARRQ